MKNRLISLALVVGLAAASSCATSQVNGPSSAQHVPPDSSEPGPLGTVIYGAVAVVMLPFIAVGWSVVKIGEIGDEKVYIASGLTEAEVDAFLASQPGKHSSRSIRYKEDDEYWKVKKGGKIHYARFRDGVTVDYKDPNKAKEGIAE